MQEMTIPVTMHLTVRAYRAIEPRATAEGITAGAFCARHFDRMVDKAAGSAPASVTEVTDLPRPALLALREMVAAGADEQAISTRFAVSAPIARRWHATIAAELRRARDAADRQARAKDRADERRRLAQEMTERRAAVGEKRSYVRLDEAGQAELVRLIADNVSRSEIAKVLGISVGSVVNWEKRLAAVISQTRPTADSSADECHWQCGAAARGIAYMTEEHTYPAPSCGEHGYDFQQFISPTSAGVAVGMTPADLVTA